MKDQILKETPVGEKMNGVFVANSQLKEQPKEKIIGTLTSRIEVKPSTDIPAYGFFKFDNQEQDIPVIFRIKEAKGSWIKPPIKKGSTCELTGHFTETGKERPSFTCFDYQLLQEPKPLTSSELQALINELLSTSIEEYRKWTGRKDFLFKKLDELKEIETLSKLGNKYLEAYLLLKSASYANYQPKHLLANFDLKRYLQNIHLEIEQVSKHIEAYQSKEK